MKILLLIRSVLPLGVWVDQNEDRKEGFGSSYCDYKKCPERCLTKVWKNSGVSKVYR